MAWPGRFGSNCCLREPPLAQVAVLLDELGQFRFRDVELGLGTRSGSASQFRDLRRLERQPYLVVQGYGQVQVGDGAAACQARDGDVVAVAYSDDVAAAAGMGTLVH